MITYDIKVRKAKTYLWGGAGIITHFEPNFYFLVCRVDEFGETIQIYAERLLEPQAISYGQLEPNQVYIVPLEKLTGLYAVTIVGKVDSQVRCSIISAGQL